MKDQKAKKIKRINEEKLDSITLITSAQCSLAKSGQVWSGLVKTYKKRNTNPVYNTN